MRDDALQVGRKQADGSPDHLVAFAAVDYVADSDGQPETAGPFRLGKERQLRSCNREQLMR